MDDVIYKNTEMLLKRYRDVVWSLEVSKLHLNKNNNTKLDKLEDEGCFMSEKSYYRKKSNAIKLLGEILFGCSEYVIKDVFELLN